MERLAYYLVAFALALALPVAAAHANARVQVAPALYEGGVTAEIPITLPSGAAGMQPDLRLRYTSMRGSWSVELPTPPTPTTTQRFDEKRLVEVKRASGLTWKAHYDDAGHLEALEYTLLNGRPVGKRRVVTLTWDRDQLTDIDVWMGGGERASRYELDYADNQLAAVYVYGLTDDDALPPIRFGYEGSRLIHVDNGIGAKTSLTYDDEHRLRGIDARADALSPLARTRLRYPALGVVEEARSDSLSTAPVFMRHLFYIGSPSLTYDVPAALSEIPVRDDPALAGKPLALQVGPDPNTITHETWTRWTTSPTVAPERIVTNGAVTDLVYDETGHVVAVTDHARGLTALITYASDWALPEHVEVVDTRGHSVSEHRFEYDELGNTTLYAHREDGQWRKTRRRYDRLGNVTGEIDENGVETHTTYSDSGAFPVRMDRAGKFSVTAEWNEALGVPTRVRRRDGFDRSFDRDGVGRISQVRSADEVLQRFDYSVHPDLPNKIRESREDVSLTTFFDGSLRPTHVSAQDALGTTTVTTRYTYRGLPDQITWRRYGRSDGTAPAHFGRNQKPESETRIRIVGCAVESEVSSDDRATTDIRHCQPSGQPDPVDAVWTAVDEAARMQDLPLVVVDEKGRAREVHTFADGKRIGIYKQPLGIEDRIDESNRSIRGAVADYNAFLERIGEWVGDTALVTWGNNPLGVYVATTEATAIQYAGGVLAIGPNLLLLPEAFFVHAPQLFKHGATDFWTGIQQGDGEMVLRGLGDMSGAVGIWASGAALVYGGYVYIAEPRPPISPLNGTRTRPSLPAYDDPVTDGGLEPIPAEMIPDPPDPVRISDKLVVKRKSYSKDDGVGYKFRANRKRIPNYEKIVGQPEATVPDRANLEMYAAMDKASQPEIVRVVMGREADMMINDGVRNAKSVDVVAIENGGKYQLAEAKGTDVTGAISQLRHSAARLGVHNVTKYTLYVDDTIGPGYFVKHGVLYEHTGVPVQINDALVNVVLTTQ